MAAKGDPLNIKKYDPFLRPISIIDAEPDESPFVCLRINQDWIPALIGSLWPLRYEDKWQGDIETRYVQTQRVENLIYLLATALQCGEMETMPLRQKPGSPCVLQQSLDGGLTWNDVFDFAACLSAVPESPTTQVNNYNQAVTTYNTINNQYAGDPANIDARLPYGDSDDSYRDAALCAALQSWVEHFTRTIATVDTSNDDVSNLLNFISASSAISGLVIGGAVKAGLIAATAFVATPGVLVGLGAVAATTALGAAINDLVDDPVNPPADLLTSAERTEIVCCMYRVLSGSTLTEAAFQASLDGSCELSTRAQAVVDDLLKPMLQERSVYLALLTYKAAYLDNAIQGVFTNDCLNGCLSWCYAWDFVNDGTLGSWSIITGQYPGTDGGISSSRPEIETTFTTPTALTAVTVTLQSVGTQKARIVVSGTIDNVETEIGEITSVGNGSHVITITDGRTIDSVRVTSIRDFNHEIAAVKIDGRGDNPYGEDNC